MLTQAHHVLCGGDFSAPAWAGNNQVETAPADSEQASIEQDHELLIETKEFGEDLEAKATDAREKFAIVNKSSGEKRTFRI